MGQHTAASTPTCHAVRYDYLAGINLRLTHSMDARLRGRDAATLAQDEDPSVFFDRADPAMYASKGNGRNLVTVAHV